MKTTIVIISLLIAGSGIALGYKLKSSGQIEFQVQYVVECSSCAISYRDELGNTVAIDSVKEKWDYGYTTKQGHYAFIAAQTDKDKSMVSVNIIVDGQLKAVGKSESKLASAYAAEILHAD